MATDTKLKTTLTPLSERKVSKTGKPRADKTDWTPALSSHKTPGVSTRLVGAVLENEDGEYTEIQYTERKLVKVTDPVEATKLLKLKPKQAVRALTLGANKLARADAVDELDVIAKIAEKRGISMDEARKRYQG